MHTDKSTSCSRSAESEVSDDSDESVSLPVSASGNGTSPPLPLEELKSGLNLDKCVAITYDSPPHDLPVALIGISSADQDCKRQEDGAQDKLHDAIVG
jgi:hypothetical protein